MSDKLFRKKIKLGYKEDFDVPEKSEKKTLYYPSMWINDTDLPIEPEDVGKTFTAQITLEIKGIDVRTNSKSTKFDYSFDIKDIAFQEDK